MQRTKVVLSRSFERLLGPFVRNHWVALTSSAHSGDGADRCAIKGVETIEEMGRMVFDTLANARMVHAEKTTAPERDLEFLSRHVDFVLASTGCSLASALRLPSSTRWSPVRWSLFFRENAVLSFLLCTLRLLYLEY